MPFSSDLLYGWLEKKNHGASKREDIWQASHSHEVYFHHWHNLISVMSPQSWNKSRVTRLQEGRKARKKSGLTKINHLSYPSSQVFPASYSPMHVTQRGCAQYLSNSFTGGMTMISEEYYVLAESDRRSEIEHIHFIILRFHLLWEDALKV